MGYESNLYICAAPHLDEDGAPRMIYDDVAYCQVVAEYDLSKMGSGPVQDLFQSSIKAEKARIEVHTWKHGIYERAEGNTQYSTDKYGDPLAPVSLDELVAALRQQTETDEPHAYRRLAPALALLQAFSDQQADGRWGPEGILVLHYGH